MIFLHLVSFPGSAGEGGWSGSAMGEGLVFEFRFLRGVFPGARFIPFVTHVSW